MIEQIYVNNELEIISSIEEGCRLVRDNYSVELGDLLIDSFDKLTQKNDNNSAAYEKLHCELQDANALITDLETELCKKTKALNEITFRLTDISCDVEDIDMPDDAKEAIQNLLDSVLEE